MTQANEKYCGDLKQKKTITPDYLTHRKKYNHGEEEFIFLKDHHEPIIDRKLWEEAQRETARRDLDGRLAAGHGNRYPLSGKIKCGKCGHSFVSRSRKRTDGSRYKTWRCGTAAFEGQKRRDARGNEVGCDLGYQLPDEAAADMLRQSVSMLKIDREEIIISITGIVIEAVQSAQDSRRSNAGECRRELEQIREKKLKVLDAYFAERISQTDMQQLNTRYDGRIAELTASILTAEKKANQADDMAARAKNIRTKVTDIVNTETVSDDFCGSLLDQITVFPGKRLAVSLKCLPTKWTYALENQTDRKSRTLFHDDPSVPISVKVPDTSL